MAFSLLARQLHRSQAIILLIITAVMWSSGGILIKLIPWHPIAIAGGRSAMATLLFLIVIRKPKWNGSLAQVGAAIAYAGTVTFFVAATKLTTAANAILLQYTAPVYVALFGAWLLKERTSRADWFTVLAVVGGMILFFLDDLSPGNLLGNVFGMLSGVSFGALALFMRKQKDDSPLESVLLGNVLTVLIALPFFFRQPAMEMSGWVALGGLGLFQLGIPYVLYCVAIKYVTALDGILVPVIEPILNPLWVLWFLGEKPGPWALVGGFLVLSSVTIRCLLPIWSRKSIADTT